MKEHSVDPNTRRALITHALPFLLGGLAGITQMRLMEADREASLTNIRCIDSTLYDVHLSPGALMDIIRGAEAHVPGYRFHAPDTHPTIQFLTEKRPSLTPDLLHYTESSKPSSVVSYADNTINLYFGSMVGAMSSLGEGIIQPAETPHERQLNGPKEQSDPRTRLLYRASAEILWSLVQLGSGLDMAEKVSYWYYGTYLTSQLAPFELHVGNDPNTKTVKATKQKPAYPPCITLGNNPLTPTV